jgi:hypothetical protein
MIRFGKVMGTLGLYMLGLSCSSSPKYGTITEKRYEPERNFEWRAAGYPAAVYRFNAIDHEDFVLVFRNGSKTDSVLVKKSLYDSLKVGDVFDGRKMPHTDFLLGEEPRDFFYKEIPPKHTD